jgi:hypothetical protein
MGHALLEISKTDNCSHPGPCDLEKMLLDEQSTGSACKELVTARGCAECRSTLALVEDPASR